MQGLRTSLSTRILAGVGLGVLCGLFLGEYAAGLSVIGDAFVGLLQMTVLPYITLALIANIGRLSPGEAKRFGAYSGLFLMLSVLLTLTAIVLLPLALPERESASFFSTSVLQESESVDFVELFIPSNPFHSLANNVVPAVVLFCIAVGLAMITLQNKRPVLEQLDFLTAALGRINHYLVQVTPIGVFAIVASIAGTMNLEEFARLEAYLVMYSMATFVLAFGVLLPILAALTPFSYRELFSVARAPLLTAFATGKVLIVLPMLVESAEELFARSYADPEKPSSHVRAVTPLVYPFPHAGKLLALLFVPFAAWFVDQPIAPNEYPAFLGAGLFSLFGSPIAAMPFLLDMLRLPADMFQLFLVSGILAGRLGDLLGTIHLLFVSVLTACALTGGLQFRPKRLLATAVFIVVLSAAATGATRAYLGRTLGTEYDRDRIVGQMHSAVHEAPSTVHRDVPPPPDDLQEPALQRIARTGILRVGYFPDNLPWSFFNAAGELVGYDIDMAYLLAEQLGARLEFIPFEFGTLADQLDRGDFDLAMSGVATLPTRLAHMRFGGPYTQATAALLVRDHRRDEFAQRMTQRDFRGVTVATARSADVASLAARVLPGAEFITVDSGRSFMESDEIEADALIWNAESGSAWTLLYPEFSVVLLRPLFRVPVGYPIPQREEEFADFITNWTEFIAASPLDDRLYDHWILGENAEERGPRWSGIRNVLHWVE